MHSCHSILSDIVVQGINNDSWLPYGNKGGLKYKIRMTPSGRPKIPFVAKI